MGGAQEVGKPVKAGLERGGPTTKSKARMAGVAKAGAGNQEDTVLSGEAMAEGVDIRHRNEMDEGADAPRGGNPLDQSGVALDPLGEQLPVSARLRETRRDQALAVADDPRGDQLDQR